MPSKLKQINVRADESLLELERGVRAAASAALGLELSQSDLYRMGLAELAKKYPPAQTPAPVKQPTAAATRKRRRGK